MAQPTRDHFAALTARVENTLENVSLKRIEYNPQRVLWEVRGSLGEFGIRIKEIFTKKGRLYSYYVIKSGEVVVGFDNYPDRQALRRKYGRAFVAHLDELIPHKHGPRKATFELGKEMTVEEFLKHLCQKVSGG